MAITQDNLVLSDDLTTLLDTTYLDIKEANIPSTVTHINNCAFKGCTELNEIFIPKNVERIGISAFENCKQLATVTFESGSCLNEIDDYAFSKCGDLVTINLSDCKQLERIYNWAFQDCNQLRTVLLPSSLEVIGSGSFAGTQLNCITADKWNKKLSVWNGAFEYIPKTNCLSLFTDCDRRELLLTVEYSFKADEVKKIRDILKYSNNPVMSLLEYSINKAEHIIPETLFIGIIYAKSTGDRNMYDNILEGFQTLLSSFGGYNKSWWAGKAQKWFEILLEEPETIKQITEVLNEIIGA